MNPFRFAVVGTGEISGFYMDFFQRRADKEGIVFAGAFDLLADRARPFCEKFGGRYYETVDAVLADRTVDAVVNLTPAFAHADVSKRCLEGGKHVHTEKPIAMKVQEARELLNVARRHGVTFASSPFIILGECQQTVKRMLREGRVGRPITCTAELYHGRIESWRANAGQFYRESGGPILDVGPYPLSLMIDWFGPVRAVRGMCAVGMPERRELNGQPFTISVYDHGTALLRFESGVMGRIDFSNCNSNTTLHGMEIQGTDGSLAISAIMDAHGEIRISGKDAGKWDHVQGDPAPKPASGVDWSTGIFELAHAVREGRRPANSADMALHVLEVARAIEQAASSGQEVLLSH